MRTALISGITGQDGFYLKRLLETEGYVVGGWGSQEGTTEIPLSEVDEFYFLSHIRDPKRSVHAGVYEACDFSHFIDSFAQPHTKIFVASSTLQTGVYGMTNRMIREVVEQLRIEGRHIVVGTMGQHISARWKPTRSYLMSLLRDLVDGKEVAPERPSDLVFFGYAPDFALAMYEHMQDPLASRDYTLVAKKGLRISDIITYVQERKKMTTFSGKVWLKGLKGEITWYEKDPYETLDLTLEGLRQKELEF